MQNQRAGFTLFEVLIATVVTTVGIVALLGTLAASAALAGDGRRMGLAAARLASRADELRARISAGGPGCAPPVASSAASGDGIAESWSATRRGNVIDLILVATYHRAGRLVEDTVVTAVSCP